MRVNSVAHQFLMDELGDDWKLERYRTNVDGETVKAETYIITISLNFSQASLHLMSISLHVS